MKKIIIFLLLIVTICCNKKESCDDNKAVREIESANIVQTLIDSITGNKLPICTSLKKLYVRTDLNAQMKHNGPIEIVKLPPVKNILSKKTDVYIEKLLEMNFRNNSFFDKRDSLNFLEQNYCLNSSLISKEISKKNNAISLTKIESKNSNIEYIIISNPIFSSNNKKVYIEIDTYTKIYKHGTSFFLEKIGKTWKIIYISNNWSSC